MKKILIILIVINLFACSSTSEPEKTTELTWYVNFSWYQDDFNDSLVSQVIEEKFNVDLKIVSPSGDASRKLESMVNQDKLADIMTLQWWNPQITKMIENQMIYPLNQLAEKYQIDLDSNIDQLVYDFNEIAGNLYYYPNSYFLPEDYQNSNYLASNQTFLVRKDIYEALGEPDMTSIDGYYNSIVKASELYPEVSLVGAHEFNSNGNVSFDEYLMNFLAIPFIKEGQLYDRYTDPDYLEWLRMYNLLYRQGYIDESIFTDKKEQMDEKLMQGNYFSMIFQRTDIEYAQINLNSKQSDMIYIAVDGPKNSNGDDPVLPGVGINGWCDTMISKNSKNPELAIKIVNYLLSDEGQKLLYLGVEGETYTIDNNNNPVVKDELQDLYSSDRIKFNQEYGFKDTYWMLEKTRVNLKWQHDLQGPLKQLENWAYPYTVYPDNDIRISDDNYIEIKENIDSLWSKVLIKLLTAKNDEEFDNIVADFVESRSLLNYDYYRAITAKEIERNLNDLVNVNE